MFSVFVTLVEMRAGFFCVFFVFFSVRSTHYFLKIRTYSTQPLLYPPLVGLSTSAFLAVTSSALRTELPLLIALATNFNSKSYSASPKLVHN